MENYQSFLLGRSVFKIYCFVFHFIRGKDRRDDAKKRVHKKLRFFEKKGIKLKWKLKNNKGNYYTT